MRQRSNFRLVLLTVGLTVAVTAVVILAWETTLRPPFFSWVEARYPGPANAQFRWDLQQRVEHFFISATVDAFVVTLLLRLVGRQQRRIQAEQDRYRALFEHANDGIAILRAGDHRIVEVNDRFASIAGVEAARLAGQGIESLRWSDAGADNADALTGLIESAPSGGRELIVRRPKGTTLPALASFDTLNIGAERLVILIVRDLSERKRLARERESMQLQLLQSSKLAAVGELSAGVAHEINNPLNGVINLAQLLKDQEASLTAKGHRMLDGIIEEGGRITKIVRDLLTFARRDGGGRASADVMEAIATSLSLFGRQLERDGIVVEVRADDDLPPVRADGSRLRQVVVNIISNARHALGEKGDAAKLFRITARRATRDGRPFVRLDFYDNGPGISRHIVDKVFDPFFTTRRDSEGTGLGLSLSFAIVRESGGTISVETEEGRSTTFRVELPVAD